jgi:hypothetical protein
MFLYTFDPHYGLLRCTCGEIPIVHSIPIFREFERQDEVLALIKERHSKDALILTLGAFASHENFEKKGPHDPRTKAGQARLHDLIDNPLMTTQQFLTAIAPPKQAEALYYRPASAAFMAGIGLAGLIGNRNDTIVHVSCGAGHLSRALAIRHPPERFIGVDEDFSVLYAARRFMSEESHFICASLGSKLPIRNGVVKASIIEPEGFSTNLAAEIDRVVEEQGLIMGTQFTDVKEFTSAFGDRPGRGFSIDRMAKQFVKKRAFDASFKEKPVGDAAVVVTRNKSALRKVVLEDLLGCRMPRPSPVYDLDDKGETFEATRRTGLPGSVVDEALLVAGALPEEAKLDKQLLKEVQDGEMSPKALDLLSRLVIVDLPQDYS